MANQTTILNRFPRTAGRRLGLFIAMLAVLVLSLPANQAFAASGVISGRLWNDLNNDKSQSSGEPGLPNVTVKLRFAGTDGILGTNDDQFSTQATDNAGNYAFTGLDAGKYQVTIDYLSGPLLLGFDINTANEPLNVTLALDEVRSNTNFGFIYGGKSAIGNYVWDDVSANGNWTDEGAEFTSGLANVQLSLYLDLDGSGTFNPGLGGDLLALQTTTDNQGKYSFPATANGNEFWVRVDPSNFQNGGALEGYVFTNGNGTAYDPDNPMFVPLSQFVQTYTTADFGFVLPADVQVTKSDSPDPVQSGNTLTYTLTIDNHGPATATNVVVTDTLPGAANFVSASPGAPTCTESNGQLTCNLGNLASGASTTVTVVVTVTQGAAGQIVNRAGVSSDTYDTVPGNNLDSEPTQVINPAIAVEKSASPTVILSGGNVAYTFLVTNPGDVPLATVQMSDDTCAPVTFSAGDTNNNSLLDVGETWRYTCSTTVAVDTTNTITVSAQPSDSSGNPLPQIAPVSDTDTADVNVVAPAIQVVKAVNLPVMYVGERAYYTFTVTNPGDVPLRSVSVLDNVCSPVLFQGGDLDSDNLLDTNESWIYTCNQVLNVSTTNTATTAGQPSTDGGTPLPGISPVTDQDQATVSVIDPAINVVKTASAAAVSPGDTVIYSFAVTNPGNDPLSNVSLTDNKCSPVTFSGGDTNTNNLLDLNETWTYTCQAVLNQDTTNIATATGNDTLGNPVSDTDTEFVDVVIVGLQVNKSASAATIYAGEVVTYTYTVENSGSDTINSVVVVDNQCATITYQSGDTGADSLLAPGEVWTYLCSQPLNVDTANTVIVTGKDELGNPLEDQAQARVDVINPDIVVEKRVDLSKILAGDTVVFTFDVSNPGDDPLTNVVVSDDQCSPLSGPTGDNGDSILAPGEVWRYTCSATPTVDTVNIVSVSGDDSLGNPVQDQDTETVDVVAPAIQVIKTATPKVIISGDLVEYNFLVSNEGDVALANIAISDDKCAPVTGPNPAGDVNSNGLLDVDETWVYNCVTSVGVDTTNVVTVSGQPSDSQGNPLPGINPVGDTDTQSVDVVAPQIDLVKVVSRPVVYSGESVVYTFTLSNPGDITLRDIVLTDNRCAPLQFQGGDTNNNGRLETSESWIYTCQATLSGDIVNTANVSGRPSDPAGALYPNLAPVRDSDSAAVNVINPAIRIVKRADSTLINPGDSVSYTFDVTNIGDDPLSSVVVGDNKCSPITGPNPAGDTNINGLLDPAETWQYTCGPVVLTQDTTNTATVTANDTLGNPVSSQDTEFVNVVVTGLDVDKVASAPIVYAGDTVIYTYTVRNTGTDPISTVQVDDNLCAPAIYQSGDTNSNFILNSGEVWLYSCSTTLTKDTVNTVTASGKDPLGQPVSDLASASVNVINPAIKVVKDVDRTVILAGTLVEYTFVVTNPGDDPLTNVSLRDNKCSPLVRQSGDTNSNNILEPGEIWTYTCSTTLNSDTVNVVTVSANDSLGNPVSSTGDESVDVVAPAIQVTKAADRTAILAGDVVRYTFLVSNIGDTPLGSVSVSDNKCSPISSPDPAGDSNKNGLLDPNEVWSYACTTAVNQNTTNTVTASGRPTDASGVPLPGINPVTDQDTATVSVVGPAIHIEKDVAPAIVYVGGGVVYTFTVTNPGDTPLRDVVVSDDHCSPLSFVGGDDGDGLLEVGESWRYTCSAAPTQDIVNTATVVGRPANGAGALLTGFSPVSDTDTAEVDVITPSITVVKSASELAVAPGTVVTYTFAASNSGDDPLTNVSVSDNLCSPVTRITVDANGQLDPGETWIFQCSTALTKDTTNVATATATDSLGNPTSDTDSAFVEVIQASIDLIKTVDQAVVYLNGTVNYTLQVVNIGNDPIFNVNVTDTQCSSLTGPTGDTNNDNILNVIETWTYTCSQSLAVDTLNTAVVTAEDGLGQPLTDDDGAAVNVINPKILVRKSVDRTVILPGNQVIYTYQVTNPGDDPLSNVAVSDDKCSPLVYTGGDANATGRLEPGETWRYSCAASLSVDTTNIVSATGTDSLGGTVQATDTKFVDVINPAINVVKSASRSFILAGEVVQYTYLVTNPGDVALANVTLADDTCPATSYQGGDADNSGLLEPGETWTFTCSAEVVDDTTNTATATGLPVTPSGVPFPGVDPVQDQDTAFVDRVAPDVILVKVANPVQIYSGGTAVYTYTATNVGDVPLASVSLVDDKCSPASFVSGDNGNNLLDPGESWVYTCSTSLTKDTLNTATISGQPSDSGGTPLPGLPPVNATATATVDVITPALTVVKSADAVQVQPGGTVVYTFRATNSGDAPLNSVVLSDDKCSPVVRVGSDGNGLLDPGETWTFQCSTNLTQDTTNVVTATATDPLGNPVSDTDTAFVNVLISGLRITKVASANTVRAGATVVYTYQVVNTGTDPVINVAVGDDKCSPVSFVSGDNGNSQLDPTETWIYTCSTALSTDTTNIATVTGTDLLGTPVSPDQASQVVNVIAPAINVDKSVDQTLIVGGDTVVYTYLVTNHGDDPLRSVVVSDDKCSPLVFQGGDTNANNRLDPGENWRYTCSTSLNVDTVNVVTATGVDSLGAPVSDTDTASVDVVTPAIAVVKSANPTVLQAGTMVTYTFLVSNPGETPLASVTISDNTCSPVQYKSGDTNNNSRLDINESWTYTCVRSVTQDTTNVVTVSGLPTDSNGTPLPGADPVSATDTATVDVVAPGMRVVKTVGLSGSCPGSNSLTVPAGTAVTYCYQVTNTGDTPLTNIVVGDDVLGNICTIPGPLAAGGSQTCTATATINQNVTNIGTATGQPSDGQGNPLPGINPVTGTDTATVTAVAPGVTVVKTVSPDGQCPGRDSLPVVAGTGVTYCYQVTNTGDTFLTNLVVSDDVLGNICTISGPLAAGGSQTCTATATINQNVTNIGTVTGQPSDGQGNPLPGINPVSDTDTATVTVVASGIRITKTADPAVVVSGGTVTFTLEVVSLGNDPLSNVTVTDNQCTVTFVGGDTNGNNLLESTETWIYRCTRTITQDTVNTATASGQPSDSQGNPLPGIDPVSDTDTATVDAVNPSMTVVKTASTAQASVGDVVTYTYQITNTGDVSLSNVIVSDDRCSVIFRVNVDANDLLDPAEVWTYRCLHTVLSTDPNPLVNVVTVTATDPLGGPLTESDTATVSIVTPAKLVSTKRASLPFAKPGDTLGYVIVITNTGGAPATGVMFTDTPDANTTLLVGTVTAGPGGTVEVGNNPGDTSVRVNIGTLAPGASITIEFSVRVNNPFPNGVSQVENQGVIGSNELPDLPTDDPATPVEGDVTITPVQEDPPLLKASKRVTGFTDNDQTGTITPGDGIQYEIILTNEGLGSASDILFLDTPDSNTTLVVGTVAVSRGTVQSGNTAGDAAVGVLIPSMASSDVVAISFQVTINKPLPAGVTQVSNQGVVQSNETGPQPSDDPSEPGDSDPTVTDVVVDAPKLSVAKRNSLFTDSDNSGGLSPGDAMQYEIVIKNSGTGTATGVSFTDNPDPNTTLIVGTVTTSQGTVTRGNNSGDTSVLVNVGNVVPGQEVTIRLWVRIKLNLPAGVTQIVNQGTMSGVGLPDVPTDDPSAGGASDPTAVDIQPVYNLFIPMVPNEGLATPTPTPTFTPTPTPTPTATPEQGVDNFVGQPIDGLVHPKSINFHKGQNMLFVVSRNNNRLLKVDPLGNQVVAQAETGSEPWGVAINEITNRVYVSNFSSADVWVYDAVTLNRIAVIRLGNAGEIQPALMGILPNIDTVAVVLRGPSGGGIAIIEGLTVKQVVGATGAGPYGIAVDTVNNRIFVANRDGGNMRMIYRTEFGLWKNDGRNFTFTDRRVPFEVEYNSVNKKLYMLYVINQDWYVDIWQLGADDYYYKSGTVAVGKSGGARDPNVGGTGLAINTTTGNVFVANTADATVSVIDGDSNQVKATLTTGPDPFHIAVNPNTQMVYVGLRAVNRLAYFRDVY